MADTREDVGAEALIPEKPTIKAAARGGGEVTARFLCRRQWARRL